MSTREPEYNMDEIALCKGCNTAKHLDQHGLCGRCAPEPKQPDLYHKPTIDDALKPARAIPEPKKCPTCRDKGMTTFAVTSQGTTAHDVACPNSRHTPEPELNVEAAYPDAMELLVAAKKGGMHGAYAYGLLHALIQQVSDQRMREFVALLKASYFEPHEKFFHVAIEAALKDYLSHKEQSQ